MFRFAGLKNRENNKWRDGGSSQGGLICGDVLLKWGKPRHLIDICMPYLFPAHPLTHEDGAGGSSEICLCR
jgi:hypothetical protein